jgi:large subunit ribosomal protein L4
MELELLNSSFEKSKSLNVSISLEKEDINKSVVHQVVKSFLANRRQGTACTKNKASVQGGGKKPFKQKGTGRARQGSTRSPLMPGGGTVFGPQPRSFEQKINKKHKLIAVKSILADKFQAGKLFIIEDFNSNGKTKDFFNLLKVRSILSSLVVVENEANPVLRAVRNIPSANGLSLSALNVYSAVKYENLLIEKKAFEKLLERFK